MYAASVGHIDILKFLMEKGVLLEEKNEDGFTALHWAAYVGKKNPRISFRYFDAPNLTTFHEKNNLFYYNIILPSNHSTIR